MIKIYIPINKGKKKSIARGFWIDKNKVYYDYILPIEKEKLDLKEIESIKQKHNQLAVFYSDNDKGFIYTSKENIVTLQDKKTILINKSFKGLKEKLKAFLKQYSGLTIYNLKNHYLIEIYY